MTVSILRAIDDPNLMGSLFPNKKTWAAWRCFLKALFGIRLTAKELKLFQQCTGRDKPTNKPYREVICIIGRRGGKTRIASAIAKYLALFFDYTSHLSVGERAIISLTAAGRSQTRTAFNYISDGLDAVPMFRKCVLKKTAERIELNSRVDIEVTTASHRTIRGRTIVCAIMDEAAFFFSEGAVTDTEIYRAIKPSMATIPNSLILVISSPYAQTGLLYDFHNKFYGVDDPEVLVWKADSLTMNPLIDKRIIDRDMQLDREAAESEWYAAFRKDLSTFLDIQVIEDAIIKGRKELPPIPDVTYTAFVDPAGGSGKDWMTLAIAHREDGKLILDSIKAQRPNFDPYVVTENFVETLREYKCGSVTGDKYAGDWPTSAFSQHGIRYVPSTKTKSEIYLASEPLFSRGQIELLDNKQLFDQLRNLERRTRRAGRDVVDHPVRGHDDIANAVCGAMVNLSGNDGFFHGCDLY